MNTELRTQNSELKTGLMSSKGCKSVNYERYFE